MSEHSDEILKLKQLKRTQIRTSVLEALLESPIALSQAEIESRFQNQFDRITLYRTLRSYEEKGIVHRIYNSFGEAKYAACTGGCHEHSHSDHHVHFNCLKCKRTYCINELHVPAFQLPQGMKAINYNFSIEGFCKECLPSVE